VFGAELVTEEPVDPQRLVGVRLVKGAEDVDIDALALERVPTLHHLIERPPAALVDAVGVMDLLRTVDRDAHQEIVLLEERCPRIVDEHRVRLHRVLDPLTGLPMLLRQFNRAPEEIQPHHRRLAALPRDRNLGCQVRLYQLLDVRLERLVRHPKRAAGVERLLREEEAVGAVEVADGARRLGEEMERRRRLQRGDRGRCRRPRHQFHLMLPTDYCLAIAIRKRSSGSMKWSWSSSPRSICTQWILPVKRLVLVV
jgi:hypothetical protein